MTLMIPPINHQKLQMAITYSNSVQMKHMSCFLTSTENVDVKKHLIYPIWNFFEYVTAFRSFLRNYSQFTANHTLNAHMSKKHSANLYWNSNLVYRFTFSVWILSTHYLCFLQLV